MSHTLTTLDDGSIIVLTMNPDFDAEREMMQGLAEVGDHLDARSEPTVFIVDSRELHFDNLNEILRSGNAARSPEAKHVSSHPNLLKSMTVSNNKVIQTVVKGFNSVTFGSIGITIFETIEEAVNAAREMLNGVQTTG